MKHVILLLLTLVGFATIHAQNEHPKHRPTKAEHAKIEQLKRAYFSEKLDLNTEDSIAFWPIYDHYSKELRALHHEIKAKYRCQSEDQLSEAEYKKLVEELVELEKKEAKVKAEFMLKIGETIGYEKALRITCLEHQFRKRLLEELRARKKQ
ncbi:hypothetical protein [Lishizhenia sp.]|uniref:hypothetical protein n=1 Tax=Lishizhenia sp. TaxID=2497594 RepID=UPI00299D297D|nr:hypothetical protein [Lishizhenia sp.]MDX1447164.1 hypothetical protein [Lishizhenia sp.]